MAMLTLNGDPEKNKKAASGNKLKMKQAVTPKVDSTKIVLSGISASGSKSNSIKDDEPYEHYQEVSSGGVSKYYRAALPNADGSLKSRTFDIRGTKGVREIEKDEYDKGKQTAGQMPKLDRDSGKYTWD
jgi:hypothetical protein